MTTASTLGFGGAACMSLLFFYLAAVRRTGVYLAEALAALVPVFLYGLEPRVPDWGWILGACLMAGLLAIGYHVRRSKRIGRDDPGTS